jgi:hypothetical protein
MRAGQGKRKHFHELLASSLVATAISPVDGSWSNGYLDGRMLIDDGSAMGIHTSRRNITVQRGLICSCTEYCRAQQKGPGWGDKPPNYRVQQHARHPHAILFFQYQVPETRATHWYKYAYPKMQLNMTKDGSRQISMLRLSILPRLYLVKHLMLYEQKDAGCRALLGNDSNGGFLGDVGMAIAGMTSFGEGGAL